MIQIVKELEKMTANGAEAVSIPVTRQRLDWQQPEGDAVTMLTDFDREDYLSRLAARLAVYAAKFGLSAEEIASVQRDAAAFRWAVDEEELSRQSTRNWAAYKKRLRDGGGAEAPDGMPFRASVERMPPLEVSPGIFWRIRCLARRIRNDHAYTYDIGRDLGISNISWLDDLVVTAPRLTVRKNEDGAPEIHWPLLRFDRLRLEVNRNGDRYHFLAFLAGEKFVDAHPLPVTGAGVVWRYRGLYSLEEDLVGTWSEPVIIHFA